MKGRPSFSFDDVSRTIEEPVAGLLERVVAVASERGVAVALVGGPVRDLVLDRPLDDVDLRVDSDARGLADAVCAQAGEDALRVVAHDRFGTLRLESERASLDLATMRHETYASPGALPDVSPGTLEQDTHRRDFTVNALHLPLDIRAPRRALAVVDGVGGLEDLAARRLRVLHPRSFHDDPTRAWRASRFAARLGFRLERTSRAALRSAVRDGAFGAVSGERFKRELELAFGEARHGAHAGKILRLLADWHVLGVLEPGLGLERDRLVPLRRLSKAIESSDWSGPRWQGWQAGLAIWLAPQPAALRRRVLERFAVRGEVARRIVDFGRTGDRSLRALSRARGRGAVDAVLTPLAEETVQALYACADLPVRRRILRWGGEDRRRRLPVTGRDLVDSGLEGAEVGKALARIRSGFLDGEVANREEAVALAEELAKRARRRGPSRSGRKKRRPVAARKAIPDTSNDVGGGSTGAPD